MILYGDEVEAAERGGVPDYPVHLFLSQEGYFKKITPQSLRMSGEQEATRRGTAPAQSFESHKPPELLFFSDKCQVYKIRQSDFDDTKASVLGEYIPAKLGMDEGESVVWACLPGADYAGELLFFFENGKAARVALAAYRTTSNRRKPHRRLLGQEPPWCASRRLR